MGEIDMFFKMTQILATTNEKLLNFSQTLRQTSNVQEVKRGMDCRLFDKGLVIEQYVEATIITGTSICWWLELSPKEAKCEIEFSILLNKDSTQKTIKRSIPKAAESFYDLESKLEETVNLMFSDMDEIVRKFE